MTAMPQAAPVSNTPELTVSELSAALKRTVEDRFGYVRVRGEISGLSRAAFLRPRLFLPEGRRARGSTRSSGRRRCSGLKIKPRGRAGSHRHRAAHDLSRQILLPDRHRCDRAGRHRRADGAARGARAEARRRGPVRRGAQAGNARICRDVIGVVTSPTGAVIRDILHRLARPLSPPRHRLAGAGAGRDLGGGSRARRSAASMRCTGRAIPRPDVLIVARGGGSLEDLLGFNEELVVRAAADSADPADLRDRPRDRLDADRSRRRSARADADRRGGKVRPSSCRADGKPWQCRRPPRRREPPDH